uniref:Zinc finger, SWIM-type n=1 Tax=Tanacetum cinerariifolium TaxID=118510 RepID=A0A699HCU8_TANCI|nr:zinc finger, SWIM-type [Tanacetum cinerariifolium]
MARVETDKYLSQDQVVRWTSWAMGQMKMGRLCFESKRADTYEAESFILGIQTEWRSQQMLRFGHRSFIAVDSTFGIKRLKINSRNALADIIESVAAAVYDRGSSGYSCL